MEHGCHYASQAGQPDYQSSPQLRMVCFAQNNRSQPFPEAVNSHYPYMADEEYDEHAKCEEMKAPCPLPPMKEPDILGETSGDSWGHRYARCNTKRREQEDDSRVAELLQGVVSSRRFHDVEA